MITIIIINKIIIILKILKNADNHNNAYKNKNK